MRAEIGETPLDVLRKENELLKQTISSAEVAGKPGWSAAAATAAGRATHCWQLYGSATEPGTASGQQLCGSPGWRCGTSCVACLMLPSGLPCSALEGAASACCCCCRRFAAAALWSAAAAAAVCHGVLELPAAGPPAAPQAQPSPRSRAHTTPRCLPAAAPTSPAAVAARAPPLPPRECAVSNLETQLTSAGVEVPPMPMDRFAGGGALAGITPEDFWSPAVTGAQQAWRASLRAHSPCCCCCSCCRS